MKAALLLRCSTDSQDYERQYLDLKPCAEHMGYEVSEDLVFGEYITGRDNVKAKDRLSIANLKAAVKDEKVDAIFINEVSRLSRDSIAGRQFVRDFLDLKIPVYFRDISMWTINPKTKEQTPSIEQILGMYFDAAANYLKSMKSQLASGKRRNARSGKLVGGVAGFGFYKDGENKLKINEEEAELIRIIFNKYLESSIPKVVLYMRSLNKTKHKLSSGAIGGILRNRIYLGERVSNLRNPDTGEIEQFHFKHDAIIDEDTFNQVQNKLAKNRTSVVVQRGNRVNLLSKTIYCPNCNHRFTMQGSNSGQNYTYFCPTKSRHEECVNDFTLNAERIENIIWHIVKEEVIALHDLSKEEREERIHNEEVLIDSYTKEIQSLKAGITKQESKKKKLLAIMLDEDEDMALFAEQRDIINAEIEKYQKRIIELNKSILECNNNIAKFSESSFDDSFIKEIEQDRERMKSTIKSFITGIYPRRYSRNQLIIEVETPNDNYTVLFEPRNYYRKCWIINSSLAKWQAGRFKSVHAQSGNFFYIPMASLLIQEPDDLDALVTFEEMKEICKMNNMEINY